MSGLGFNKTRKCIVFNITVSENTGKVYNILVHIVLCCFVSLLLCYVCFVFLLCCVALPCLSKGLVGDWSHVYVNM